MKRFLLFATFSFIVYNVYYFVSEKQDAVATHAVSNSEIEVKSQKTSSGEELVSVGYATISHQEVQSQEEDTFEALYPNLKISGDISEERLDLIKKTILSLPAEKLQKLRTIRIKNEKGGVRGLGGSSTIILNDYQLSDQEFVSVLIHELGHAIDLGGIQGSPAAHKSAFNDGPNPIYENDLSVKYYAYSWENSSEHNNTAKNKDFVSGYSMTDPFEDFAESFAYYVLHNQDFKTLAKNNEKLGLKYAYIRDYVFDGKELDTGTGEVNPNKRVWDITKLAIELWLWFLLKIFKLLKALN